MIHAQYGCVGQPHGTNHQETTPQRLPPQRERQRVTYTNEGQTGMKENISNKTRPQVLKCDTCYVTRVCRGMVKR